MPSDTKTTPEILRAPNLFFVAGEPSGDMHAANLIKAIREKRPETRFTGLGGPLMEEAGCVLQQNMMNMSWMGFAQSLFGLPQALRLLRRTLDHLDRHRPHAIIPVDFPGFNLMLARFVRKRRIPVIYYISPQIWAWAPWRIRKIRRRVSKMLVIFPFEEDIYKRAGVPVEYVGHPLFEHLASLDVDKSFLENFRDARHPRTVGLLPGSRLQIIKRTVPVMFRAAERIHAELPETRFLVSAQQESFSPFIESWAARAQFPVRVVEGPAHGLMKHSDLCLAASGTATLELAHFGTPMVVLYRVPPHSYLIGRALLTSRYFCLVNIVAGREVVPEMLLWRDDAKRVAGHAIRILTDESERTRISGELERVRELVDHPGAGGKAADAVLRFVDGT